MKLQRPLLLLAISFGIAVLGTSCHPYGYAPATKRGAVAGGLIGAGVGTIVGSQSDRPLEGAAIGGAIGALGGAALGSARDDHYRHHGHHGHHAPSYRYSSGYRYSSPGHYHHSRHYRGGYYGGRSCGPYYGHGRYY